MKTIPTVVITSMPKFAYFQWFILGLYMLEEQGKIKLKFRGVNIFEKTTLVKNQGIKFLARALCFTLNKCGIHAKDSYLLKGYAVHEGKRTHFCIDCADSPFLFSSAELEHSDIYFKIQCPIDLGDDGFRLGNGVIIPWTDHEHEDKNLELRDCGRRKPCLAFQKNKHKIRPLMIGVRQLSRSNTKESLMAAYQELLAAREVVKTEKCMCYFGNALGPAIVPSDTVDVDNESSLMYHYGDKLSHPNLKRAKASDILNSMGKGYDGRVINNSNSDSSSDNNKKNLYVPLEEFSHFVAQFEYNLNISGYRLSIPNRFIDSFVSGTAIITDKLSLRWYLPFGKSVFETIEMGYLPDNLVEWEQFKKDLRNLPTVTKQEIISDYEEKWSPLAVANYMITLLTSK